MSLARTPLLLERARPTVTGGAKARTRMISSRKIAGRKRRGLLARLERRFRDRANPQPREVKRSAARIRHVRRRKSHNHLLHGRISTRARLMKGRRS